MHEIVLYEKPYACHKNGMWLRGLVSIEAGMQIVAKYNKKDMKIPGVGRVSPASGRSLFLHNHRQGKGLKCFECGIEAQFWVIEQFHSEGVKYPHLNLYAKNENEEYILMTRDHIIPRAYGGKDDVENLRVACTVCNNKRKTQMTEEEMLFMQKNQHLIRN